MPLGGWSGGGVGEVGAGSTPQETIGKYDKTLVWGMANIPQRNTVTPFVHPIYNKVASVPSFDYEGSYIPKKPPSFNQNILSNSLSYQVPKVTSFGKLPRSCVFKSNFPSVVISTFTPSGSVVNGFPVYSISFRFD